MREGIVMHDTGGEVVEAAVIVSRAKVSGERLSVSWIEGEDMWLLTAHATRPGVYTGTISGPAHEVRVGVKAAALKAGILIFVATCNVKSADASTWFLWIPRKGQGGWLWGRRRARRRSYRCSEEEFIPF